MMGWRTVQESYSESTIARLTRELSESREQQKASAEILSVISSSPTNVQPVFDMIAERSARLCNAEFSSVYRFDGELIHFVAQHGLSEAACDAIRCAYPMKPSRKGAAGRSVLSGKVEEIPDINEDLEYALGHLARAAATRAITAVPILKNDRAVGAIIVAGRAPGLFPARQIALLQTFADQAVIAIENVRLFDELQERTLELSQSLEQQTATSDVLRIIASSPTDVQPVLTTVVECAARLCEANDATIMLRNGDSLLFGAHFGPIPMDIRMFPIRRDWVSGRSVVERKTIQVDDLKNAGDDFATGREMARRLGHRTTLSTPLLREGEAIGTLILRRTRVAPFTAKQIELVETFADQAVIAIENARLFEEVQARNREITEALEQQMATGAILRVIAASPTDIQPVLQTVAESATRFCDTHDAVILLGENGALVVKAHYGPLPLDFTTFPIGGNSVSGRAVAERKTIQVDDLFAAGDEFSESKALALRLGHRTMAVTPLMRDEEAIGVLAIRRLEVRPFSDKQIELLKTFADQAVIAIENVRLFEEVQARTAEVTESLKQQTATADVLKVISRSTFDLQAVLDALAATVTQLCEADGAAIMRQTDGKFREVANYGYSPEFSAYIKGLEHVPGRGTVVGRVLLEGKTVQIPDLTADTEYTLLEAQRLSGIRTVLGVPLLREGLPVGVLTLTRSIVKPFSEKQIELVETFADQAVIAIENVRLFEEVKARTAELDEALTQQTATAEVLKVISRSTFDLNAVLQALIESAAQLCNAQTAGIYTLDGGVYRLGAAHGQSPEFRAFEETHPDAVGRGSWVGRAALERSVIHVPDVSKDTEHAFPEVAKLGGFASVLCVPLMREGEPIGIFALTRPEVGPFAERQIDLIKTFADQAVIAIENVRLFDEVNKRTDELMRSLDDLRAAQDRLIQTEKLASLGQLTAGIAHEIKNPLNFVNNFSSLSGELIDELTDVLDRATLEAGIRSEIRELMEMLRGNLDKVVEHGKRADSIVKNMLLHSREGSGEHLPTGINALVEESLNLAYHGARAERKDFNITLQKSFDPDAGEVDLYPQEITRVLLNLISNGFHATRMRGAEAKGARYEPMLSASTMNLGDKVEIRIRDNGTGIPAEVMEKMFNPFFTSKPAGEGTGLGLSLSYDIVVKQHAGTINVDTRPGEFAEFTIVLPRGAASLAKRGDLA
jgi:two-component system NtrC family sensor kinase